MNHQDGHYSQAIGLSAEFNAAKSLASELIACWPSDRMLSAHAVLESHPELQNCKSAIVELAYEEFCRRQEAGEKLDPEAFADNFSMIRGSLLDLIQVHQFLDDDSRLPGNRITPCWPKPGEIFLGYRLQEELGRGAFSRVFFAEEVSLGNRLVVVKVTTMGRHEAHTLGQLQHPHVVPVFSVHSDDISGLTAVCMPYLGRTTLFDVVDAAFSRGKAPQHARAIVAAAEEVNRGSAPIGVPGTPRGWRKSWNYAEGILYLGAQVAEALAFTHSKGFLHCDIKPSNVLVTEAGQALLFDFNLSFLEQAAGPTVGGTIPYMAPEQLELITADKSRRPPRLDARTDIFGLAVTLFELLTGRLPFGSMPTHLTKSQTISHFLERQRRGPPSLRSINPQVDSRIASVIESCLSFRPEDRLQNASELAGALWLELAWHRHAFRWLSEHRRLAAGVLVAASVASGGAVYGLSLREPYPIRELQAGWTARQQGDLSTALIHLDRAIAADKQFNDARFARGLTRMEEGDWEGAWGDFRILENQLEDARVLACLGHLAAISRADYANAIGYYNHAIEQGFSSAALLNNLAYCYDKVNDLGNAERCLRQALAADPKLPVAVYNLARLNLRQAVDKGVIPDTSIIEKAISLGPESVELDVDAARIFAVAAGSELSLTGRQKQLERCLSFCARAARLGSTRRQLRTIANYYKPLEVDPRFQELLQSATEGKTPSTTPLAYMVNPLGRIDNLPGLSVASR
jgi:serine/threonine protein kinase/TPR repeat protein